MVTFADSQRQAGSKSGFIHQDCDICQNSDMRSISNLRPTTTTLITCYVAVIVCVKVVDEIVFPYQIKCCMKTALNQPP